MTVSTFNTDKDSKIQGAPEFAQHIDYGAAPALRCDVVYAGANKTGWERGIIEFDISFLDGKTLTAAKLTLPVAGLYNDGETVLVSRITRPGDWPEGKVDWIHYDHTSGTWTDEGADFDHTGPPAGFSFLIPASTGDLELTDSALLTLCNDALDNHSGILSLLIYLSDEDPGEDTVLSWTAATTELEITWTRLVERSYPRGVGRGVGRGVV